MRLVLRALASLLIVAWAGRSAQRGVFVATEGE
jgi:hypothetical protein